MALLSLVVPAKNEEGNIPRLYEEISAVRKALPNEKFEIIVIDNDSKDRTGELVRAICAKDKDWKYVKFSRDFGSEASIAAGLRFSRGDVGIVVFSDLQDPPDRIPDFLARWREGFDVVYGVYEGNKHEKLWKRVAVGYYYKILSWLAECPMRPFAADFRLYDRKVINVLVKLGERNRYLRGLGQWVGFKTSYITYERRPRTSGKSKAPFFYLFSFAFSVIVNFSDKPLRLFLACGLAVGFLTLCLAGALVANYFFGTVVPGLTTTHVLLSFNLAFSAFGFGILGEYIAKIYKETKERPLWIVESEIGFDNHNIDRVY